MNDFRWCTLIIIWDELWPSSEESRFPGRPADSQFEQISTESHMAQWKRAPTMSSKQLQEMKYIIFCKRTTILFDHLLSTFNSRVCHRCRIMLKVYLRAYGQKYLHCSLGSKGMGGRSSGSLRERAGLSGTTRKAWDGWISWTWLHESKYYVASQKLHNLTDL